MRLNMFYYYGFLLLCLMYFSSCTVKSYEPVWPDSLESTPTTRSSQLLTTSIDRYNSVDNEKALLGSIESFKSVLELDPGNKQALSYLCNEYILLGTAHTVDRSLKYKYFQEAMSYCQLSMYTNPEFKNEVDSGKKPWEAAQTLQADDAPAMLFWVTALQYEFKEAMTLSSKIYNVSWMRHALQFLDRITEVAPDYGNGAVELAYTVCYCVLPEFYGGDLRKCYLYMDKTIERSNGFLLGRWARGKYFHQVTGDHEASSSDLEWVVQQDISNYNDAYPWRIYFKEDAMAQLSRSSE